MRNATALTAVLFAAALAMSCGGGGGSSAMNTEAPPPTSEQPATGGSQSTTTPPEPGGPAMAMAMIQPTSGSQVSGQAHFQQSGNQVQLHMKLQGLPPGEHGVHIHMNGECGPDGMAAGDHWNPSGEQHGKWGEHPFHLGDIGNISGDTLTMTSDRWTIGGPPDTDIVGKTVVVHEKADDYKTQPSGNSGKRIACGVIERVSSFPTETQVGGGEGGSPSSGGSGTPGGGSETGGAGTGQTGGGTEGGGR